ncbi:MAG: preprotein translocase subunit YajC [Gammaproteobacteria bacterium]|nr:preprotein translocase subunit YajC [Gammaproteobacteria bacterium]
MEAILSLFVSNAWAEGGASQDPGFLGFLPLIILFVVFYFLLIRPQMKRAKEHKTLVGGLSVGDEVITNGGIMGKIRQIDDGTISLEVADGVEIKLQRNSIASSVPKGSLSTKEDK